VYTPRKAMSAIVAAEAMHRLPRLRSYGPYPGNTTFGDFHVSSDSNLGELVPRDAFLYAGSTHSMPPQPAALRRIAGYGSSPVVTYEGEGIYFLDKVRPGIWRLEVYPDAVPVADPFEPPNPEKIVTRAIRRSWPMTITLPDLGGAFTVQPIAEGNAKTETVTGGRFTVTPGVYVLSAAGPVNASDLPKAMGNVGFAEYHAPPPDSLAASVQPLAAPEYLAGRDAEIVARVAESTPCDSAVLYIRPTAGGFYRSFAMHWTHPYLYAAALPRGVLREGSYEFVITLFRRGDAVTFPTGLHGRPTDWDYYGRRTWKLDVVGPRASLRLFTPGVDAGRLAFTRIGDAGRRGLFRVSISAATGQPVFHFALPVDSTGWSPLDYTASLVIRDRIRARQETITSADQLVVRLRGLGSRQTLRVALMEDDGTTWSTTVTVDSIWREQSLPLATFTVGCGVLLPQGFPGEWNYWVGTAAGRGGTRDRLRLDRVERLQLSLDRDAGPPPPAPKAPDRYGVEVESVLLGFGTP